VTRRVALAAAILAYGLAVLAFRPHPTAGPPLRDFEAYYAAGASWNAGEDPYGAAIWTHERTLPGVDARREGPLPFVNPPPLLPALGALARLPFGIAAALWETLLILALAALLVAAALIADLRERGAWFALLPLALAFGPVSSDLALGQLALLAVAAAGLAAWSLSRDRAFAGGAGALVTALQPTLALPLAAFARSWRALHALLAAATVFALGWIALAGYAPAAAPLRYFALLRAHDAAERFALIQYAPSAIAFGAGADPPLASAVGLLCAAAALGAWWFATARLRLAALPSFVLACALLPFAAPFFHEHDFSLLLVPALYAMRRSAAPSARAIATAGALLCAIDWLGLAQRPDGAIQSLLLICAFLAASIAAGAARPDRSTAIAVACVAAAFVAAALLAHGDPAPVWPDAMRLPPPPLSGADVAGAWHAQQVAAHMFDVDALHAWLRAMPLLGCAAIAWATARSTAPSDSRNP
jgi:hypothetical protein